MLFRSGWEFVLPSATVYRSVTFQVDAKSPLSVPPTYLGMQNFTTCARVAGTWYDTCFDRWKAIGNATGARAWFSTATTAAADRSGRYVRGIVDVSSGTTTVYGARLLVVYQTLQ